MRYGRFQADDPIEDERRLDPVAFESRAASPLSILPPPHLPATLRRTSAAHFLSFRANSGIGDMVREELRHERVFLFSPVFLGIGAIGWFELPVDPSLPALVAGFLVFAATAFRFRYAAAIPRFLFLMLALLFAGALLAEFETWRRGTVLLDSPVTTTIIGIVERREASGEGRWRYIVRLTATREPSLRRPPERISVLARGQEQPIATGAMISGRARLSPPSGPALPYLNDFGFSAFFDGIGAFGYFYGAPEAVAADQVTSTVGQGFFTDLERRLYDIRSGIGERIRSIVPGDAGAFAAAIVTDERRALSRETTEALRLSGLAHIIAISGLNMALAAGIFFVGLRGFLSLFVGFAQAYPVKKIAAAGALAAACAYYLISGFAVSAERAFLMMAIMLIAVFVDRPSISLRNVALSALLILVMAPSEALGPSFQMSFAATLALVSGYSVWKERPASDRFAGIPGVRQAVVIARFFGGIFLTSVIGGLSTAIFSIEHFHKLATYGLPANLAAMPIISFIVMPAGLIGMLLMPFGLDTIPLEIMGFGLQLVIDVADYVASWGGEVTFGQLHPAFFPLSVVGLVLMTVLRTKLRLAGAACVVVASVLAFCTGQERFDMIVSEDGRLVALVDDASLNSNRKNPGDFIFAQWQRALIRKDHIGPTMLENASAPEKTAGKIDRKRLTENELQQARNILRIIAASPSERRFTCLKKAWCTARVGSTTVITLEDSRYAGFACDSANIVIAASRLRFRECRSGALLLTADTLRRTGALSLVLRDDPQQWPSITAALSDIRRPWTRHRDYTWRTDDFSNQVPPAIMTAINDSGG